MINRGASGFFSSIPVVTKNLIIINLIFWLASIILPRVGIDLIKLGGLHFPLATDFNLIQFVSYMFLHDTHGIYHVFFNMFAVYMFGRVLENVWGPKRFLVFYMITGIGAGLIQELVWTYSLWDVINGPYEMINLNGSRLITKPEYYNLFITIGASGAVFGILLAFGMLFPNVPIYLIFFPVPIKAKYFVIFYGLAELFLGVVDFKGDSVAHFAHLGGMLFGYIMILYWKKKDGRNGNIYV